MMNRPLIETGCLGLLGASLACGGDLTEPALGSIEVTIAMSGANPVSDDGLAVSLDQGAPRALVELETRFHGLESGAHTITLENLALNCTVAGSNPVSTRVISGQTAEVHFTVPCSDPGTLIVVTQTTATNGVRPESYRLTLDGKPGPRTSATGRTIILLGEGHHEAELSELPPSCAPTMGRVLEFSIVASDTTEIRFDVACPIVPVTPTLEVRVTTEELFFYTDPNGYTVVLDDARVKHVGTQGTVRLTEVSFGPHEVQLSDLASGCSYPGPQQVSVTDSVTVLVPFRVTCAPSLWP
jgi:hypothetical protein